jgi:hypothetical protein
MSMPKSDTTTGPQSSGKGSDKETKVYRSVAEIRRAFYPKAGREMAKAHARASHELLRSTKDAAL